MSSAARTKGWYQKLIDFVENPLVRVAAVIVPTVFGFIISIGLAVTVYAGKAWAKEELNTLLSANPRISMTLTASEKMDKAWEDTAKTIQTVLTDQASTAKEIAVNKTVTAEAVIRLAALEKSSQLEMAKLEKETALKESEQDKRLALLEQDMNRKREDDRVWQAEILKLLRQK